jgi:hypothetical protein
MERSLLWSALALGCVGGLSGILLARTRRGAPPMTSEIARPFWVVAVALPILVFLATLPSSPPFAAGQGLGRGFLLGAVGALLSAYVVARAVRSVGQPVVSAAIVTTPCWPAIAATSATVLFMRGTLIDSLSGVAIGWVAVSAVLLQGATSRPALYPGESGIDRLLPVFAGALFAITLCTLTALGVYRGAETYDASKWIATGLTLGAGVPLALLVSALPAAVFLRAANRLPLSGYVGSLFSRFSPDEDARSAVGRLFRLVTSVAIVGLLAWLVSTKLIQEAAIWKVALVGLLGGVVAWWLIIESGREKVSAEFWVPLAVMLSVAGLIVAFRQLAGFGIGLLVLTAWLPVGMAMAKEAEATVAPDAANARFRALVLLLTLLAFGTVALLWRLVYSRFDDDIRGVSLTDYYAIFGFLVGALLPGLLSAIAAGPRGGARTGRQLLYLVIAGLLTLAVPAMLLTIWKAKFVLALLAGLAVSTVQTLRLGEEQRRWQVLATSLFAVAVALVLSQWMHHALGLASLSRADKTRLLMWGIAGVIGVILAFDYGERLVEWRRQRRNRASGTAKPAPADGGAVQ